MPVGEKKDQIWQGPHIERQRRVVGDAVARGDFSALIREAARLSREPAYSDSLRAYLLAVETVKRCLADNGVPEKEKERALAIARRVLDARGIHPRRSRLTHLHRELSLLEMELAARQGRNWQAAWYQYLAGEPEDRTDPGLLVLLGERYLRLGDVPNAIQAFIDAEPAGLVPARLGHIRALRLKGSFDGARHLAAATPGLGEGGRWEEEKLRAMETGDLLALSSLARESGDLERKVEVLLWAAALPTRRWWERRLPLKTALGRQAQALPEGHPRRILLRAALAIEAAQDGLVPVHERVRRLGEILADVEKVPTVDQELLVWAAAARWLLRIKQPDLMNLALSRYQGLCLRLSVGTRKDLLSLFGEDTALSLFPLATPAEETRFRFHVMLRTLPTGQVQRLSELAKMGMAAVGVLGRNYLQANVDGRGLVALCEVMAGYLGKMRGPAMKLGQMMGNLGFDLPPEARRSFQSLQDGSPPVDTALLERVVEEDFGKPVGELFRSFSRRPFATGSVGQVHRAVTREGDEVVVKIQYPGMREIVRGDFRALELMRPLMRRVFSHWDFGGILDELRSKILEECDYLREAENQEFFHRTYAGDDRVLVPRVFREYSSARVLTSEFVPGRTLESFAAAAGQGEKNRAAETMFRWHYENILNHRYFNTDPHGGNYLFLKDRVAFVDFGNVKLWRSRQSDGLVDIILGLIGGDRDRFLEGMVKADMVAPDSRPDLDAHYRRTADGVLKVIARDEPITIEKGLVKADVTANLLENPDVYRSVRIHRENAFLFKTHWGFYATLSLLSPTANWHRIARSLASGSQSNCP